MTTSNRPCRWTSWLAVVPLALLPVSAMGADERKTRATMAELVDALAVLLPVSLNDSRFEDPANRERIASSLRILAASGSSVEQHGDVQDAGFGFLSRSLARDTREIQRRFAEEKFAEARFLLHELTDNCVACHSRLPDGLDHPLGQRLFVDIEVAELPPEERARLETATRQFDQALESYESLFASSAFSPGDVDLMGFLDAYLEICLRVKRDPNRALTPLRKLAARPDTKSALRGVLEVWISSLEELATRPETPATLAEGRALVKRAQDHSRFPDDRRALAMYVAASGILQQYVSQQERSKDELAEAYYLLGVIESHVGRSFWLSQTEHFLEASIETAPGSRHASDAYDLLEEFVVSGYTGSSGRHVPADVRERLETLKALIEAAQPS